MNKQTKNWLVIGVPQHWETALSHPVPIWGLRPHYQAIFDALNTSDIVWLYATSPVRGVIGLGMIKDKYIDDKNLVWLEELKQKEVIWPLRFRIQVLKVITPDRWKKDNIKIADFNLNWQIGFQPLGEQLAVKLMERLQSSFDVGVDKNFFSGATITSSLAKEEEPSSLIKIRKEQKAVPDHRYLQDTIAEIGKLQFYHTQLEYPIELPGEERNLDVVWKREITGVPTFAFEVELSGMVEKAVSRLRFAYKQWNSRPRIVVPKYFYKKVNNIIAAEDRDFSRQLKMYEPAQVFDLLNKKRELKTLEQDLELY
jgi:hypothetical protein